MRSTLLFLMVAVMCIGSRKETHDLMSLITMSKFIRGSFLGTGEESDFDGGG